MENPYISGTLAFVVWQLQGSTMPDGFTVNVRSNAGAVAMELLAAAQEMRDTALMRALNKMADQVKVQGAREVKAAGYGLKIGTIKAGIRVRRATPGSLRATVIASGRPIPMIEFSARQTARGVSVNVQKGRKVIAGAFIATMPNGHRGVFVRKDGGKHRKVNKGGKASWHELPIRELYGPAVPDGLANKSVQQALQAFISDKFPSILEHEHTWLRTKASAR